MKSPPGVSATGNNYCPHLATRTQFDAVADRYTLLMKRIIFPVAEKDDSARTSLIRRVSNKDFSSKGNVNIMRWHSCNSTAELIQCINCHDMLNSLICCCLDCPTVGCLEHVQSHMTRHGHLFGVSLNFGELLCCRCGDFVYHRRAERIRRDALNAQRKQLGLSLQSSWNPGRAEMKLLRSHSPPLRVVRLGVNSTRGLRGLVNLGNTCFMNCIIQTLTHIPMLRDYFLSDQHNCQQQIQLARRGGHNNGELNMCLMCELSHIFQEFYDGSKAHTPYIPNRMLHLVWTHAEHLAGYEQHDAHEFLISALNVLHKHSESASAQVNPHECKCIIDRLFTGQLQSDLTCTKCGRVSTTVDPYWDISLELNGEQSRLQHTSAASVSTPSPSDSDTQTSITTGLGSAQPSERTLDECLENFVKPEMLGSQSKIKCDNCGTYEESMKQLTLRKLPIVACFHLKRFEHTLAARRKKIKDTVKYPEFIDLTPYTTAGRNTMATLERGSGVRSNPMDTGSDRSSCEQLERLRNRYSLIAVVNHNGTTESGHYTCCVRHQRRQWYKCNDTIIARENVANVLLSEGYLLFYSKMFIDYD